MYYPLLRARQFELIALRELAIEQATQETITPILEPVNETLNNLNIAHKVFLENKQQAYLILNTEFGSSAGDSNYYIDYINSIPTGVTYLPAFHYRDNAEFISDAITQNGYANCLLICQNDIDSESEKFTDLVALSGITKIAVNDPQRNRPLNRLIRNSGKYYIRLDDLFEKQPRNSYYLDVPAHLFSEEHKYFSGEGFSGFSDYTVLPSEYIEGGSTPRAVVIHLTYLHNNNQMWIRHFTSETNGTISNVQGKFAEAAEKAVSFCREESITNSAIRELENYYDNQHYPGLGTIKKVSIKNHLLVISSFLSNR